MAVPFSELPPRRVRSSPASDASPYLEVITIRNITVNVCVVMEEKMKQNLEFIAPEVKVVSVTSQRVLCESETIQKSYPLDEYDRSLLQSID